MSDSVIPDPIKKIEREKDDETIDHNLAPTSTEKMGREVEKVARDLNVNLPKSDSTIVVRLIGLFTLVGGLSIIGGAFADLFNPEYVNVMVYILRVAGGLAFIIISYGLLKKLRWAIWLFSLVVIVGAFFNLYVAILPAFVVLYLISERNQFAESRVDELLLRLKNND